MNVLLDTHAFLWFVEDSPHLSIVARQLIEKDDIQPYLSIASLWEMAIKISLGKLTLATPFEQFIPHQLELNSINLLNVSIEHTSAIANLPFHHRDPFDRLLAVQARIEKLALISTDSIFDAYGIERIW